MSGKGIGRRGFVKGAAAAALGGARVLQSQPSMAQFAVPNSTGTAAPRLKAPANACDCHHHIYDGAHFPPVNPQSRMQTNGAVAEYRLLQKRIGTARNVIYYEFSGAISHVDGFDFKETAGTQKDFDVRQLKNGVYLSHFLFPRVEKVMDKVCLLRSLKSHDVTSSSPQLRRARPLRNHG